MNKVRIFINIHYLEIGGAETSLIGLLQALDPDKVNVDLFLNDQRGEMMRFIPKWVRLLPMIQSYAMIERPMVEVLSKGFFLILFARIFAKIIFCCYSKRKHPRDGSAIFGYIGKYVTKVLPSLHRFGEYDIALSFLTPHDIVLHKVEAKKKICWIHTDYTNIDVNKDLELPVWNGYDNIISISKEVTKAFCSVFPSLENKIIEIENILSPSFILNRANKEPRPSDMPKELGTTILLTIGRFSFQKRLEEIPIICRMMIQYGNNVKWYIIGYGGDGQYIIDAIAKEGMQDHVILLGKRTNPYPYIKACDWYIQPSRYEGKSVVVREAQVLKKPVIVTAYPTSFSQIIDRVDGIIVPMPIKDCAISISSALNDKKLQSNIINYLRTHDYGNNSEIEKIYSLIS